jgi:hypothetical protein
MDQQSSSSSQGFLQQRTTATTALYMSSSDNEKKQDYSRQTYLREEAESPFRKVRIFFYFSLGGGALTSLAISVARIAAGLNGINADLLNESLTNAAIDTAGLVVLTLLYQRDMQAQESRLKRVSKGAQLAKLMVRGSKQLIPGDLDGNTSTFSTSLASLRRGRGIEKRVVLAAAGKDKINDVMQQSRSLDNLLSSSDLLIVPIVMPQGIAPTIAEGNDVPPCVALPVGSGWKEVINDEAEEALKQGVDLEKEGFCVILKKNGRVGQRTRGIFLDRMVGEVTERRDMGLDVKNI